MSKHLANLAKNGEVDIIDEIGFGTTVVELAWDCNMMTFETNCHRGKNSLCRTVVREF